MQLKPENTEQVILTTCILQNFITSGGDVNNHNESVQILSNIWTLPPQGGDSQHATFHIREQVAKFIDYPIGRIE